MKRSPSEKKLFIGVEVENTPFKGLKTLFSANQYDGKVLRDTAYLHSIDHIFLCANQSFALSDWPKINLAIKNLLELGLKVTIDVPAAFLPFVVQYTENENFCVMVSLKLSNIGRVNTDRVILKIDDNVTGVTNPGVWCAPVSSICTDQNFTPWSAYEQDKDC